MVDSEAAAIIDLRVADVDAGLALSAEAGWNQTGDDWLHFIRNGRTIGARDDAGRLVATAAALPYDGPFGFIGMVLVTPQFRRRGIATKLVDRCIAELQGRGLTPVLDATATGAEVYRRQGFLPQCGFDRWEGVIDGSVGDAGQDRHAALAQVSDADADAFGAMRAELLGDFLGRDGTLLAAAGSGKGFALLRRGRRALQAGPVVAGSETAALESLRRLFSMARGAVFIDVPSVWAGIGQWLADCGFKVQRSFTRMALGRSEPFGVPERIFAVAGPEFG